MKSTIMWMAAVAMVVGSIGCSGGDQAGGGKTSGKGNPIDVVYGHNDPMAIGAYIAAKEKGREKDMVFIGVDGLPGPEGGISKVKDGILAATFVYPLCVDKAVEIGWKLMTDPTFKPDKEYVMASEPVTPENADKLLQEKDKAAAGSGAPAKPAAGGRVYHVVFSQCNNAEPYRAAQNALMTKLWAEKQGVDFSIQDAQQDNKKQCDQIRTIIRTKPDLLIVAPNEREPLTQPMKEAMDAGIKVICLERDIAQPNYTTYIKCDNYAIGKMAGQFIVDYLKKKYGEPKGNIVQLQGLQGVKPEHERNDGAKEIYSKYPGIKVVHEAVADWIQSKAKDRMTEALNANPK